MARDLVVAGEHDGLRLDQFVVAAAPGASRRKVRTAVLRVNQHVAKHGALVHAGDIVTVPDEILELEAMDLRPNGDLKLSVLYADEALLAVDKPSGMQSVALHPSEDDTVANFLVAAFPEVRAVGSPLEGGLVHRLDEETSGVLVAARSAAVHEELRRQFSDHTARKQYLALVAGRMNGPGLVETAIAHDPHERARMVVCSNASGRKRLEGRAARTEYDPLLIYRHETLVRVTIRTGVRHQVRVHLASVGHPILGDRLYGASQRHPAVRRLALHASRVDLRHPIGGRAVVIDSPIPADLEAAIARLKT